jgi:uncharacterized protein
MIMDRSALEDLRQWKDSKYKKPLIIRGARQVGKTWLMKEFGKLEYPETVYINFENNQQMEFLFSADHDTSRIISGLEIYSGQKINPYTTLIIFDEIQDVPKALTALKYFHENAPQYSIVCAGSLLGVALHPGTSFPVGKVDFLDLYPLSFIEFMNASGLERYAKLLEAGDYDMVSNFKHFYTDQLKYYYYIGGMPEAVSRFVETQDLNIVRTVQQQILSAYEQDFSKHAPAEIVPRIRMLWNSIPAQLAKENKKFIYGLIKQGARAKEYEMALLWLTDCGLAHRIHRIEVPKLPLKAYEDLKAFKLYLLDVGLLSCQVQLNQRILLEENRLFEEFRGALTEQFVLQQLKTLKGVNTFYWTNDRGSAEVDFVIEYSDTIVPVEVKAQQNLKAKSLKSYYERFKPRLSIRTSMANYKDEGWLLNVPLYALSIEASRLSLQ